MDSITESLNKLKDDIYLLSTDGVDDDFIKLVKIRNIDSDLHETLILIHSNYKAEMQALKTSQIRSLTKVIDKDIELLYHTKSMLVDIEQLKKGKGSFFSFKNMAITFGSISLFIFFIWTLIKIDPAAGDNVTSIVKAIFAKK